MNYEIREMLEYGLTSAEVLELLGEDVNTCLGDFTTAYGEDD